MEIGLREWLIVGAIIVILLIVVDGWRRMRAQSNSLKIDIDDKLADLGDDSYNPELPLGTARVFKPQDGEDTEQSPASGKTQTGLANKPKSEPQTVPTQKASTPRPNPVSATNKEDALMTPVASNHGASMHDKNSPQANHLPDNRQVSEPIITHTPTNIDQQTSIDEEIVSHARVASTVVDFNSVSDTADQTSETVSNFSDNQQLDSQQPSSLQHNNIGFSAFDSVSNEETLKKFVDEELPKPVNEFQSQDSASDSFIVPDILKKSSVTNNDVKLENETASEQNEETVSVERELLSENINSSSENAALDSEPSAEQIVNELAAELGTDSNTNLAAATDNTDSIVNNLLNTRALSKQDKEPDVQARDIPNETVLGRHEAVEDQAPSRSQINLGPDKFETLLAEREQDGYLDHPASSTDIEIEDKVSSLEEIQSDENKEEFSSLSEQSSAYESETEHAHEEFDEDDDNDSAHNLIPNPFQRQPATYNDSLNHEINEEIEEAAEQVAEDSDPVELDPQSEIEALKARLKALAPDEYQAFEESSAEETQATADLTSDSNTNDDDLESLIPQRSENFDQIIAELDKQIESQATPITQTSQTTTVIDDDVNLEDLDDNISHLSDVDNLVDENQEEQVVDLDQHEVLDQTADPLMDGYKDESSANDLMAQFEHDLQLDQEAVSSEFDRPISEILRIQKAQQDENSLPQEANSSEQQLKEDALLTQSNEPALSESLLLGEDFDDQDESDYATQGHEHQDYRAQNHIEQETTLDVNQQSTVQLADDGIDHANDLGFSAFEQDYISPSQSSSIPSSDDPLMEGFEEPADYNQEEFADSDTEVADAQKSLFNDNELESVSVAAKSAKAIKKPRKAIANVDDPNVVLIVTVVAKDQYLNGAALRHVVEACGMEFGDMAVFHRFEDGADQGAVQFSMANAINPGVFDIDNMDETATPGVSFFMSMDEPLDPKNALECMMATAETVATHLNGDLLDDDRSVLRPQTKEHYRERVRIHEMNKLRQRAL